MKYAQFFLVRYMTDKKWIFIGNLDNLLVGSSLHKDAKDIKKPQV
jgi:hypothetical protein